MFYDKEDAKPPPAPLLFQIQNLILIIHRDTMEVPKLEKYLGPEYLAERAPGESLMSGVRGAVTSLNDRFDDSPKAIAMSTLVQKVDDIKENKNDLQQRVREYLEMNHFAKMRQEIPPMFNPDRHPRQQQGTEGVKELLIQEMSKIFPGFKEQKGEEKNPKEKLDGGRRTRRKRRRKKKHRTGIHMKRKTHKHKKKHRRKTKRKRRVKRRRKTTRKKRGRGLGPSKMAKLGVAALATSTAMGQGMGYGISPSMGTAAAVEHFNTVACADFHVGDIVEHSEDHGQTTDHYRPVLQAALGKKKSCKRRGKPMRQPKPEKIKKNPNESGRQFKKRKREENRKAKAAGRQAEEQERIEREAMEEMERERGESSTNTGSGQQQENTGYLDHLERVGKYTAAGLLAMELGRRVGRPRGRGRRGDRDLTPPRHR